MNLEPVFKIRIPHLPSVLERLNDIFIILL